MPNSKNVNVQERLQKAFPEIPATLLGEHNVKEQWDSICGQMDTFIEKNAQPAAQARSKS